jgi:hypothetical protein
MPLFQIKICTFYMKIKISFVIKQYFSIGFGCGTSSIHVIEPSIVQQPNSKPAYVIFETTCHQTVIDIDINKNIQA